MPHADLNDCLARELDALREFTGLLEEETAVLAARARPADLAALAERKTRVHDTLAALSAERDALLTAAGLPGGHAGIESAAADDEDLLAQWQSLLEAATQARALNERNGQLIRTHLRHAQQAMHAVRIATGADLYGANGRQGNATIGRRL